MILKFEIHIMRGKHCNITKNYNLNHAEFLKQTHPKKAKFSFFSLRACCKCTKEKKVVLGHFFLSYVERKKCKKMQKKKKEYIL